MIRKHLILFKVLAYPYANEKHLYRNVPCNFQSTLMETNHVLMLNIFILFKGF